MFFLYQFAVYVVIQSWLISEVCLSPVKLKQLSESPQTIEDQLDAVDHAIENKFNELLNNTTLTLQEDDNADIDSHKILSRLTRSLHPCEKKRIIKFNHCLGKHYMEVHCSRRHVGCLPHNVPPKCKKNYEVAFGKNGACRVATSCSCA